MKPIVYMVTETGDLAWVLQVTPENHRQHDGARPS